MRFKSLLKHLKKKVKLNLKTITTEKIRNFCIMAHIDHGKSTLADRLMELSFPDFKIEGKQVLDKLTVEKERGITIKSQSVSLIHNFKNEDYLLNLIDTPGHSDFSFEVTKTLLTSEGALLLVDACKGIQAQTMANFLKARDLGIKILPVINKCDMEGARPDVVEEEIVNSLGIEKGKCIRISAKTGMNVGTLLDLICEELEAPKVKEPEFLEKEEVFSNKMDKAMARHLKNFDKDNIIRAYVFDSWFEENKGVFFLVRVENGVLKNNTPIRIPDFPDQIFEIKEMGQFSPNKETIKELKPGFVGYLYCNVKSSDMCTKVLGKTIQSLHKSLKSLPSPKRNIPIVYASIYPSDPSNYEHFIKSIYKIMLEDPSLNIEKEASPGIGNGIRAGFLGQLHLEVFRQRLSDEFDLTTICTPPSVEYKMKVNKTEHFVRSGNDVEKFKDSRKEFFEPFVKIYVFCRAEDENCIFNLIENRRGDVGDLVQISESQVQIVAEIPLSEIIEDFNNVLKTLTKGYGSFDYDFIGYKPANIVHLKISLMNEEIESFQFLVHKSKAYNLGKKICQAFKDHLQTQQFTVAIRAQIGTRVIAKESVKARRKDVTAKCYGGDYSRKKKLLDNQKKGKDKLREFGKVKVSSKALSKIFKSISI